MTFRTTPVHKANPLARALAEPPNKGNPVPHPNMAASSVSEAAGTAPPFVTADEEITGPPVGVLGGGPPIRDWATLHETAGMATQHTPIYNDLKTCGFAFLNCAPPLGPSVALQQAPSQPVDATVAVSFNFPLIAAEAMMAATLFFESDPKLKELCALGATDLLGYRSRLARSGHPESGGPPLCRRVESFDLHLPLSSMSRCIDICGGSDDASLPHGVGVPCCPCCPCCPWCHGAETTAAVPWPLFPGRQFESAMIAYFRAAHRVARRVLRTLAPGRTLLRPTPNACCGLGGRYSDSVLFVRCLSTVKVDDAPRPSLPATAAVGGVTPHTDSGAVTVLWMGGAGVPGLEVRRPWLPGGRRGIMDEWIDVNAAFTAAARQPRLDGSSRLVDPASVAVVLLGEEAVDVLRNPEISAAVHRVVPSPDPLSAANRLRVTLPFQLRGARPLSAPGRASDTFSPAEGGAASFLPSMLRATCVEF